MNFIYNLSNFYSYVWPNAIQQPQEAITVSVAESVTAGALATSLCAEAGASRYFKGSIVAYSILSKKEILGIDTNYAERHNYANPFTTSEMAHAAVRIFKSRIGMATTGYSLPIFRPENKETGECLLDVKVPYAYICLYDALTQHEIVQRIEFTTYNPKLDENRQRAQFQAELAIAGRNIYREYVAKLYIDNAKQIKNKPKDDEAIVV